MKQIYLTVIAVSCILLHSNSDAQAPVLKGKVYSDTHPGHQSTVPSAVVGWQGSNDVILTDENGSFQIPVTVTLPHNLLIRYTGFTPDTVQVTDASKEVEVHLGSVTELKAAEIKGHRDNTQISTLQTKNVEKITEGELLTAACCNLSESFETNPSVDVNYSDAITGAKEIQLLGLSGNYTQILTENLPGIRGLAVPYGINYIPGPWMESIQVSKGAGSVMNGPEAITGQINIEFKKPESSPPLFLNLFGDSDGRTELNSIFTQPVNKHWSYMLMLHGSLRETKMDQNDDGFTDQPATRFINVYNRFRYHSGNKLEAQFGVKGLMEERTGGQMQFNPDRDKNGTTWYGFGITTRRAEVYTKTGLVYPSTPWKSMGLQNSLSVHDQQSYFGIRNYNARQYAYYGNYSFVTMIGTVSNQIKTGIDFRWDKYNEALNDSSFPSTEYGPGMYAEYSFSDEHVPWGIIAGVRGDYNNLYGYSFVPRLHVKYNFTDHLIARISGGRGLRTPHPFADNIGVFASSKRIIVLEKPLREDGWNAGINITTRFSIASHEGSFAVDAYATTFVNQLVIDQYSRSDAVQYYNLDGTSQAASLQFTYTQELKEGLTVKLAWKTDDVHTDLKEIKTVAKPLLAKNKALANIAWAPEKIHWRIDGTLQWEGPKPLPVPAFESITNDKEFSQDYFQLMAQVTRIFKKWELYAGGENLLNYTQKNPVIGASNPFGDSFDATRVWGPVTGIKIYAGIRLTIN